MSAPAPDPSVAFSIVIPGFGRVGPLKFTLRSAAAAAERLGAAVEIILVDDGSTPPLRESLANFPLSHPVIHLRQSNQGSIVARLTGLRRATGDRVLFLDSDDLIHPDKLRAHGAVPGSGPADLVYDDMAVAELGPDFSASYRTGPRRAMTNDQAALLLEVQPAPHSLSYRRAWLMDALREPLVRARRSFDPAGDVWLYYNLLLHPGRIRKLDAPLTAAGPHEELRYSQHWEMLGFAALQIAEEFMAHCPDGPATAAARRAVGEAAFRSWQRLPRGFPAGYARRLLALWRAAPRGARGRLGGRRFGLVASVLGPELAGEIVRRCNHTYASCRTLEEAELQRLLAAGESSRVP